VVVGLSDQKYEEEGVLGHKLGTEPHHSVQIYVRNVDNMMALYCLRRLSGRPPDNTLYVMKRGQLDNIQLTINTYLPIQHIIFHSDAVRFGRLHFYKQIQRIQYYRK
jgi:hypothetical protein